MRKTTKQSIVTNKLSKWFAQLGVNCEATVKLMSQSLDRKLSFKEKFKLRSHLILCQWWCSDYFKQIKFTHTTLHGKDETIAEESLSETTLSDQARKRLKERK